MSDEPKTVPAIDVLGGRQGSSDDDPQIAFTSPTGTFAISLPQAKMEKLVLQALALMPAPTSDITISETVTTMSVKWWKLGPAGDGNFCFQIHPTCGGQLTFLLGRQGVLGLSEIAQSVLATPIPGGPPKARN
jgi:hypothetical protein